MVVTNSSVKFTMRFRTAFALLAASTLVFLSTACGAGSGIGAILAGKGVADLTASLGLLSDEATGLLGHIRDQMASGQLGEEVGALLDERVRNLMTELDSLVGSQLGHAFDRLDGTLLTVFDEVRTTLTAIRTELLGDSVDGLLRTLSQELALHTTAIATHVEDVVVLAVGGGIVALNSATHNLLTWTGLGGAALLGLVFLIVRPKSWFFRIFGLTLTLALLVLGLVPQVRAWIATNAGIAEEFEEIKPKPKLRTVSPEVFTVGEDDSMAIYGARLDQIEDLSVALYAAGSDRPAFRFPKKSIVGQSPFQITLKNFASTLGWRPIQFGMVQPLIKQLATGANAKQKLSNYTNYALTLRGARVERLTGFAIQALRPARANPARPVDASGAAGRLRDLGLPKRFRMGRVQPVPGVQHPTGRVATGPQGGPSPATGGAKKRLALTAKELRTFHQGALKLTMVSDQKRFAERYRGLLKSKYRIAAGDYSLRVLAGGEPLPGSFAVTIAYPPPPPPKPNLRALLVAFEGGGLPTVGERRRLVVKLSVQEPEQIQRSVRVRVRANPPQFGDQALTLSRNQLTGARRSNGILTLTTQPVRLTKAQALELSLVIDEANQVPEVTKADNKVASRVAIGQYVQDATVKILSFKSKKDLEKFGDDDYRAKFRVSCGNSTKSASFKKNGSHGKEYAVNKTFKFSGLHAKSRIDVSFSAREQGSWPDATNDMGSASGAFVVPAATKATNGAERSVTSSHAVVRVRVDYKRRRVGG